MHTIPSALQTRLDSGVTTLCRCWVIKRADGVTQGSTDPLSGDVAHWATIVLTAYFGGRTVEKVARILTRK
jgi:hypothetical protein